MSHYGRLPYISLLLLNKPSVSWGLYNHAKYALLLLPFNPFPAASRNMCSECSFLGNIHSNQHNIRYLLPLARQMCLLGTLALPFSTKKIKELASGLIQEVALLVYVWDGLCSAQGISALHRDPLLAQCRA